MAEEWRDVVGFEGKYQVSNYGRFKRLEREREAGPLGVARLRERISTGHIHSTGYRRVTMGRGTKPRYIHRLVCEAFHGPAPEGKTQVAHFDGNKLNNRVENLRWADWLDNREDGRRLDEHAKGDQLPHTKLTEREIKEIRDLHGTGALSMREIGRQYGICHQHVGDIVRRKIWKHV